MINAILILPDADRDAGNAFCENLGWGPNNISVALSADGSEPATHWGACGGVSQEFVDGVENPSPENADLVAALIYDFAENVDPYTHWIDTLAVNNLMVVSYGE